METMVELQRLAPGLITVFGDQDHTFSSNYTPERIEQLTATAEFDKQMAQIVIGKNFDGSNIKLKLECSERDLYLSKEEVINMEQNGMTKEDILKYKQSLQNKHNEIFRDVPFERECEWTVLDNISGDYFKDKQIPKDTYIGKYTRISEMAEKNNMKRINRDVDDFHNWKSKIDEQKKEKSQENVSQTKTTRGSEASASFAKRSDSEIQIAQQIKQKNMIIKQQKEQQRNSEKPKVKTLTKNSNSGNISSSSGFANILTLTLITGFIAGAIFMIVYNILK